MHIKTPKHPAKTLADSGMRVIHDSPFKSQGNRMFSGGSGKGEKILDDLAQLAGGAVSLAGGMAKQIKAEIRARVDEALLKMDCVPRAEFERLEAMVQKLRQEQEELKKSLQTPPAKPGKKK